MIGDFIGGGQVFLHKVRMFSQVMGKTFYLSCIGGVIISLFLQFDNVKKVDWNAVFAYRKAAFAHEIKNIFGRGGEKAYVDVKTNKSKWQKVETRKVLSRGIFKTENEKAVSLAITLAIEAVGISSGMFILIFMLWSRFGKDFKQETKKEGSSKILSAAEVKRELSKLGQASLIKIGDMPLVKDSEVRHFLISGATGSGKTNLFHNLLPQIRKSTSPAVVIDQTGEMIAKYYNAERGDIIFNPLDARSKYWNFWKDCEKLEELERFARILFGFNRKSFGSSSDPFWEQSAEAVFIAAAQKLQEENNLSVETLTAMVIQTPKCVLKSKLAGTKAIRYFDEDGKATVSSILSVLSTSSKPFTYLRDHTNLEETFSLKEYFSAIEKGSNSWLFLSTKPSARELTIPLIACLTELAFARLMDVGIDDKRRVWFVIDELASLNKLPALASLMTEGRKYGACIIAGLQSLGQIYENYGIHAGSSIFGQFGTNFFFRNNEPSIGKMVSQMCGIETVVRHQKNTSFGANDYRDGVSYNEHQQNKNLVEYSDLASLKVRECYVLLPEPKVRLARIEVPPAKIQESNEGFIDAPERPKKKIVVTLSKEELEKENTKKERKLNVEQRVKETKETREVKEMKVEKEGRGSKGIGVERRDKRKIGEKEAKEGKLEIEEIEGIEEIEKNEDEEKAESFEEEIINQM